jgi:phosphatidylserine/phosphatidylglycerophosphate/cardiolipin synthase-like enzyme
MPSLAGLTLATAVDGNTVEIFENGAYFEVLLAEIRSAKRSVHFETFLWAEGVLGQRVADALSESSRAGLQVRGCWTRPAQRRDYARIQRRRGGEAARGDFREVRSPLCRDQAGAVAQAPAVASPGRQHVLLDQRSALVAGYLAAEACASASSSARSPLTVSCSSKHAVRRSRASRFAAVRRRATTDGEQELGSAEPQVRHRTYRDAP